MCVRGRWKRFSDLKRNGRQYRFICPVRRPFALTGTDNTRRRSIYCLVIMWIMESASRQRLRVGVGVCVLCTVRRTKD